MAANLSVKNVPEVMLEALRARAARNHRSLQGELMSILEAAVAAQTATAPEAAAQSRSAAEAAQKISIETLAARAKQLFPVGTPSSANLLREMRDARGSGNG